MRFTKVAISRRVALSAPPSCHRVLSLTALGEVTIEGTIVGNAVFCRSNVSRGHHHHPIRLAGFSSRRLAHDRLPIGVVWWLCIIYTRKLLGHCSSSAGSERHVERHGPSGENLPDSRGEVDRGAFYRLNIPDLNALTSLEFGRICRNIHCIHLASVQVRIRGEFQRRVFLFHTVATTFASRIMHQVPSQPPSSY